MVRSAGGGSPVQRRFSVAIRDADVGGMLEQMTNVLEIAVRGAEMQGGTVLMVLFMGNRRGERVKDQGAYLHIVENYLDTQNVTQEIPLM